MSKPQSAGPIKSGSARIFWGLGAVPAVAVAGLGDAAAAWGELEEINGVKENVRIAAASGAKALLGNKITDIAVEDMNCAQSAAEGASLGVFTYQGQKAEAKKSPLAKLSLADGADGADAWRSGLVLGSAQNFSRT